MKRVLPVLFMFFLMAGQAMAACVVTTDEGRLRYLDDDRASKMVIPISIVCDASGGSATETLNNSTEENKYIDGAQLMSVEAVPGASVTAVAITIKNSRGTAGTTIWELTTIDTSGNQVYLGSKTIELFPLFDNPWTIETGDLGANGSITLYLMFAK